MEPRFLVPAAVALITACVLVHGAQSEMEPVTFRLPAVKRSEGRVTLEYESKDQTIRQELAFSEVSDSETGRSKTSIGWVGHPQSVYFARGATVLAKSAADGRWRKLVSTGQAPVFVPELEWFLKLTYTDEELRAALPTRFSHHVGPTGFLLMNAKRLLTYDRLERHRNIDCKVLKAAYARTKAPSVLLENYMPDFQFHDSRVLFYFTVRETATNARDPSGVQFTTRLTLDYFHTEAIDKKDARQLEGLELDLNLPLGEGLSSFLPAYQLEATSESFTMTFEEAHDPGPARQLTSVAYDHKANYLRKERTGSSISVWDLNEDLLYHQDLNYKGRLLNSVDIEVALEQCSVLSVENEAASKSGAREPGDTSTLDRPYETRGTSLRLIKFLGAQRLVYMGRATVRDLPCAVYENIQPEPPHVFQMNLVKRQLTRPPARGASGTPTSGDDGQADGDRDQDNDFDFIVQYYLLDTDHQRTGLVGGPSEAQQKMALNERFWPARINLIARHKATGITTLFNSLEVHDFHLGLYGWTSRPSHLFMMPQCFDDEDEQLRVSLELDFAPMDAEYQRQMALFKYRLEFELMAELFGALDLSRLHMTEYDFALGPRGQVRASFVISDRLDDKRVSYFGEGQLPKSDSYLNNRVELQGGLQFTTESCLLGASHIRDVSLVVHCPADLANAVNSWPSCTAVFGETQPVVKLARGGREKPCQAFLFEAREPPKSGVKSVESHRAALGDFEFMFATTVASKDARRKGDAETRQTVGRVRDFDVERQQKLITISDYQFALPEPTTSTGHDAAPDASAAPSATAGTKVAGSNVRHFGMLAYESVGDCARICNLDANCRSYSYCRRTEASKTSYDGTMQAASGFSKPNNEATNSNKQVASGVRCVLSSLDLRANSVDKQLVSAVLDADKRVTVRDQELAAKQSPLADYKLEMAYECDIFERDILNVFTRTGELVGVNARLADRVASTSSASECARRVLLLEAKSADFSGATFAFCPRTQSCLTDETLYGPAESNAASGRNNNDDNEDDEQQGAPKTKRLSCELYRKRYQTYFQLSSKVVKRIKAQGDDGAPATPPSPSPPAGGIKHIDLSLNTVEECARACWQSFGHVCLSFDYCSPGLCSVNAIAEESGELNLDAIEYETRAGCLGYKRDLRWDRLRRDHLIGGHNPLDANLGPPGARNRGRGIFLNLVLLCLSAALFAAGLVVGRIFNDQLEIVTSTRRSPAAPAATAPNESSPRGGSFANFLSSGNSSSSSLATLHNGRRAGERLTTSSKFNIENEIYEDPDAIGLEDLGGPNGATGERRSDASLDELGGAPAAGPVERKPTETERRAGYIDVPALL